MALTDGIAMPAINLIPFLLLTRYSLTRERLGDIQQTLRVRNGA